MIYYSTIVKDEDRYNMFKGLYADKLEYMKEYLGTKQVSVDLEDEILLRNPNLYIYQSQ
jgi:hypothetical protein